MYVDLGEVAEHDNGAVRQTTVNEIIAQANQIISPYMLDVKSVPWHSVYEVAHRLTDRFDDVLPEQLGTLALRVFITGDACHTHSAKNLIDFDTEWSTLMAKRPEDFASPTELEDFYMRTAEFPSGFMTQCPPSMLIGSATHQNLAPGFPIGKRFKSA